MMKPSVFFYNLGQGFKGVFRNRVMTLASVLVLVACMILVGTFYLVIQTIDYNFKSIDNLNVIEVMLDKNYDTVQLIEIGEKLSAICDDSPIVEWSDSNWKNKENPPKIDSKVAQSKNFYFVSDDEHLSVMRDQYGSVIDEIFKYDEEHRHDEGVNDGWGNSIEDNPLRSSYRITFVNLSDVDEITKIKNQIDAITVTDANGNQKDAIPTEDIKDHLELYDNVMSLKNTLYIVGLWLMAIFLIISLFVIMNTIKLGVYARRHEITFMRLCGATKGFIRMPFIVEGVLIGIFSAIISFGVEFCLYEFLLKDIISSAMGTSVGLVSEPFLAYAPVVAIGFVSIGLFAGIISSSVSMKKYLRV